MPRVTNSINHVNMNKSIGVGPTYTDRSFGIQDIINQFKIDMIVDYRLTCMERIIKSDVFLPKEYKLMNIKQNTRPSVLNVLIKKLFILIAMSIILIDKSLLLTSLNDSIKLCGSKMYVHSKKYEYLYSAIPYNNIKSKEIVLKGSAGKNISQFLMDSYFIVDPISEVNTRMTNIEIEKFIFQKMARNPVILVEILESETDSEDAPVPNSTKNISVRKVIRRNEYIILNGSSSGARNKLPMPINLNEICLDIKKMKSLFVLEKTDSFGNTVYIIKIIKNRSIKEIFTETINIKKDAFYQNTAVDALIVVEKNGKYYEYDSYVDFYNKSRIGNIFRRLLSLRFS